MSVTPAKAGVHFALVLIEEKSTWIPAFAGMTSKIRALDDIDAIAEYISRDSQYHARRVVDAMFEVGDHLVDFPHAGRMVPELINPNVRERFLYSYRLIYEISDGRIDILAVIHGKRLLESIDDRFD